MQFLIVQFLYDFDAMFSKSDLDLRIWRIEQHVTPCPKVDGEKRKQLKNNLLLFIRFTNQG